MEERPLFPKPEDDDEDSDDQPKKKPSSFAELLIKDERSKEAASKDIARSLFGAKEAETTADSEAESSSDELEQHQDELSDGEMTVINRSIAEDHLANPAINEQPAPPVIEFLELIVNGVEPETAFGATKIAHQLDDEDSQQETDATVADSISSTEAPAYPLTNGNASIDRVPDSYNVAHPPMSKPQPVATKLATKLAASISKHRASRSSVATGKTVSQANERHLENQVATLEAQLTKRELRLQQLSEQPPTSAPNITSNNNPFERLQSGRSESRLGLSKPERAGHIGRMLVSKERAGVDRHKLNINSDPDQVKSMRREDLLALSANLKVQGASLKHMFENNLFSEAALRRMVEAHLRGRDMLPLLRREILDRQNDFERDPRLRNRQTAAASSDELFDKMLVAIDKTPALATTKQAAPSTSYPQPKLPKAKAKPVGMSVANAVLGVTIALLIGLILFFAFR